MRHECLVRPEDLGMLLLGDTDPVERDRIMLAVDACASCRAEMASLRPVAEALLLATGTPSDRAGTDVRAAGVAPVPVAAPTGLERLLATVRAEGTRSRRWQPRRRVLAAAAALVLLVSAGAVGVVTLQPDPGTRVDLARVAGGRATGSAVVVRREWGTSIELTVGGLLPGRPYGAWLEDWDGQRVPAGTFTPRGDGTLRLDLSALMPLTDAGAIGVTRLAESGNIDELRHDFG